MTIRDHPLFLNDDIEIEQPDWLEAVLQPLAAPDVAMVGPRLLYPDRSVQHGGMFLGELGIGRHAFRFAGEDEPGYFGLALTTRNVMAVTGACMMVRRSHFDELGGFDESHPVVNNDLDFCLRTHAGGRRIVYTPHATLIHHELASRANVPETFDRSAFANRWRTRFAKGDPFHNPNLSRAHDDVRPNEEPVHVIWSGHPLFAPEEIRRILIVKVDHIGDFITALPAIRRLQSHFPAATLHVLASPSVQGCLPLEPGISELIPFEFFHARSALGQKELTAQELDELRERLLPYRFDLAIDLRKHPETRILLRATGARFLAGFDYAGQFPWLDVTLEWERDRGLQSKRRHITDDLLHLVDAVATSAMTQRDMISPEVLAQLRDEPFPPAVSGLFARPVVCVHPGAGNEMKQWPAAHFVALIDVLVRECSVNVLLIGGPDETEISRQILGDVHEHEAVRSIVGQVPLSDLARLLLKCTLFVGNDSGPKHLAAAVGIPTIGIHSGTVDPTEWAPVGPSAVAVARKMTCSPCYLNHSADCPRELACIRQIDPGAVFSICRRFLMK